MIEIKISNSITISGYSNVVLSMIKKTLTLPNINYERIKRITGCAWAAERSFKYFKEKDGVVTIPRGMRERLLVWLDSQKIPYNIIEDDYIEKPLGIKMKLLLPLKDYQIKAVETMSSEREGICEMGTGSGKTLTILALIEKIGLTACILVPTLPIMHQFVKEAKDFYDVTVGQIGDGKKEFNKSIVVSTFQSLLADKELLEKLASKTSILVEDECQQSPAKGRMAILQFFKPKHLFGATATVLRSDGKTKAIEFLLGKIKYKFEETPLTPRVEVIYTGANIIMSANYNEIIDDMINNDNRNTLIAGLVLTQMFVGRRVLVLTKRIQHYKNIKAKLPESNKIVYIESNDEDREDKLEQLNDGRMDFGAIFGTTSLLAVGVNLKPCDTLIIACDIKCETLTRQAVGRILRKTDQEKEPVIIDLFDSKHPILKNQFYQRRKVYQSQKWEIQI